MRVAIIAPPWLPVPPPAYGGTEAVLDVLARGLVAAGNDVLLFTTGDSTCPVPTRWVLPAAAGTGGARPAAELRHVLAAYDAVTDWRPDVVHDHTLVGPFYGQRCGIPIVTTNHGPFVGELHDLYRALAGTVAVVAISHHQASTAPDVPVAAVIHHGLRVERFPFGDGTGGYALFLGRMSPDKGVHVAAAVARSVGFPLKIAAKLAEPAEHEYYRSAVAPLLGGDVEYVGEVGDAQKLALLAGARCLLNPIAWPEPFGMVMIEALACGTPVVATPCGAAPEIVDDGRTGLLAATEAALGEALLAAGELDRAVCRRAATERFSAERMVADHVALYRRVVDGSRVPRRAA
jgi:glycosyltransferase involved in cell wall biosynthesis